MLATAGLRVAAFSSYSSFHTSAISFSRVSKRVSARNKKTNLSRSAERLQEAIEQRPSVVLGTRATEELEKWGKCKLSQILVDEEKLRSMSDSTLEQYSVGVVHMPGELGYGVKETEKKLLFEYLPSATLHMTSQVRKASFTKTMQDEDNDAELRKANLLAKALDLRNTNAAGIAYENRRRIIEAFSTPENAFDTGRTEVQGMQIVSCRLFCNLS